MNDDLKTRGRNLTDTVTATQARWFARFAPILHRLEPQGSDSEPRHRDHTRRSRSRDYQ